MKTAAFILAALAVPALGPLRPHAQDPAKTPVSHRLPAGTLLHAEIPAWDTLGETLEGTDLLALLRDAEMVTFLAPAIDGIQADLASLLSKEEGLFDLLTSGAPGRLTLSILEAEFEQDEDPVIQGLVTVELPGLAGDLFERARSFFEDRADDDEFHVGEIAGMPALIVEEEDHPARRLALVREDDRLHLAFGPAFLEGYFSRTSGGLASTEIYQQVYAGVRADHRTLFAYVDYQAFLDVYSRVLGMMPGVEEDFVEVARRAMLENPTVEGVLGMGYAVGVEGRLLVDRAFLYVPGDRSVFPKSGHVNDTPRAHAALLGADVDVLISNWIDLEDILEQGRKEDERIAAIHADLDLEQNEDNVLAGLSPVAILESIQEETGIDLAEKLVPALGHHLSVAISFPKTASLAAVPALTLIFDLKDPGAVDALLDELLETGDSIEGLRFSTSEYEGHRLVSMTLVHAGLPILPTMSRVDEHLFVTLSPNSMQEIIQGLSGEERLVDSKRFAPYLDLLVGEHSLAVWVDMGSTFDYFYNLVGVVMNAVRQFGLSLSDRFDPSMLPSSDAISIYLGSGTFVTSEDSLGFHYEGRSTLANPAVGLAAGAMGTVFFILVSEQLRNEANDMRRRASQENLDSLAAAMEVYRSSVGNGSYPGDLSKLVERGILTRAETLVDPSDPRPRRVRTGTGDRIRLSYSLGRTDSLPERVRKLMAGSEWFLYTRGAWHERSGVMGRLLYPLKADFSWARFVPEDSWKK